MCYWLIFISLTNYCGTILVGKHVKDESTCASCASCERVHGLQPAEKVMSQKMGTHISKTSMAQFSRIHTLKRTSTTLTESKEVPLDYHWDLQVQHIRPCSENHQQTQPVLSTLQERCQELHLVLFCKAVEGLVPAILTDKFLTPQKPDRLCA